MSEPTNKTSADQDGAILVIHNPVAGWWQRNRLKRFLRELRKSGRNVYVRRTMRPGHATQLARDLSPDSVAAVVAAGGDGTIREVADGLSGRDIALAILPLGTANIMAIELGLGLNPKRAAQTVVAGKTRAIYPAFVNGRRFLLMASAGVDSRVVARVDRTVKKLIGKGAYVFAALAVLLSREKAPEMVARVDGEDLRAPLIIVTRAEHYGGPFSIAPEADLLSRKIFVVAPMRTGLWNMLRYAFALVTSRLARLPDVYVKEAQSIELLGPEAHPIQVDGDEFGALPASIECDTVPLSLIWPGRTKAAR